MTFSRNILAAMWLLLMLAIPADARRTVRHTLPPLWVTGYDDRGMTATGYPAGPGVCATDPRYIPLGAHIRIPGVGSCVARDTGGAIVGYRVDFWYATAEQCYAVTGVYRGASWF